MLVTRDELRTALTAAGGPSGTWRQPSTAETLAAIALAESAFYGLGDGDKANGSRATCFQIETRPDALASTPRNREWITASLENACLAAVALTHMNGLRMWPSYVSGDYRKYLPEAFPPPIHRPKGEIPYQEAVLFPGITLRELMKACGWIAPSNMDVNQVALHNDAISEQDIPVGYVLRIPVQRGW